MFVFGETVRDHVNLIGAIKVDPWVTMESITVKLPLQTTFNMRIKAFNTWTSSQNTLTKKRELETKLKAVGGKPEKLTAVQQEVTEVTCLLEEMVVTVDVVVGTKGR